MLSHRLLHKTQPQASRARVSSHDTIVSYPCSTFNSITNMPEAIKIRCPGQRGTHLQHGTRNPYLIINNNGSPNSVHAITILIVKIRTNLITRRISPHRRLTNRVLIIYVSPNIRGNRNRPYPLHSLPNHIRPGHNRPPLLKRRQLNSSPANPRS